MEYKPASNTIKLNLSHRVLRREDFATGAENEDSLRTCLLFSPTSNPSSPELEQCRTPDLLHFFSHVPKQGRILSLMAFRCLAAKTSKKKKSFPTYSSILGAEHRQLDAARRPPAPSAIVPLHHSQREPRGPERGPEPGRREPAEFPRRPVSRTPPARPPSLARSRGGSPGASPAAIPLTAAARACEPQPPHTAAAGRSGGAPPSP